MDKLALAQIQQWAGGRENLANIFGVTIRTFDVHVQHSLPFKYSYVAKLRKAGYVGEISDVFGSPGIVEAFVYDNGGLGAIANMLSVEEDTVKRWIARDTVPGPRKRQLIDKGIEPPETNRLVDDAWDWVKSHYPKRKGTQPWRAGRRHFVARVREGETIMRLTKGTAKYYDHCYLEGMIDTPWVLQVSTFFGKEKHYANFENVDVRAAAAKRRLEATGR